MSHLNLVDSSIAITGTIAAGLVTGDWLGVVISFCAGMLFGIFVGQYVRIKDAKRRLSTRK